MTKHSIYYLLVGSLLMLAACTKPTLLGSDIFGDDQANLNYTDTLSLAATTVRNETTVRGSSRSIAYKYCMVGDMTDPVFGKIEAETYSKFSWAAASIPDFMGNLEILDSVVLQLAYYADGIHGDVANNFNFQVYKMTEEMSDTSDIMSDASYQVDATPLADINITPNPKDSLVIIIDDSTEIKRAPALRVRLDDSFGEELLSFDTAQYATPTETLKHFKGLKFTAGGPTSCLLNFDLSNAQTSVTLYYRKTSFDTISSELTFVPYTRFAHMEHDYSGTPIAEALANNATNDSLLYIQGMAGTDIRIDIPYIKNLKDKVIINRAELEVFADYSGGSTDSYPLIDQFVITENDDRDSLVLISDAALNILAGFGIFGGSPEKVTIAGQSANKYTLNISEYVQQMADGDKATYFYLTTHIRQEVAKRAVLCGPNHAIFPMKLHLFYTVRP